QLAPFPSRFAPSNDASFEPVQTKVCHENDCNENDDPRKERRRVVGLRRVKDKVTEPFVRSDVLTYTGTDNGVRNRGSETQKNLRRRCRKDYAPDSLRPGRPH